MDTPTHVVCTWSDGSECLDCSLRWRLGCRFDRGELVFFVLNQIPSLALALFGLAVVGSLTGAWWPLILFAATCVVLWGLGLETRVLCSHCPYWAEESKTLHCWALLGSPKIWRYRPWPLNRLEKATLLLFFGFLVLFPMVVEGYGVWVIAAASSTFGRYALLGMVGVTAATGMTAAQFVYILRHHYCSRCVNFSCPLNHVPKALVDAYLRRNPVMREAWEQSGYRLDG